MHRQDVYEREKCNENIIIIPLYDVQWKFGNFAHIHKRIQLRNMTDDKIPSHHIIKFNAVPVNIIETS